MDDNTLLAQELRADVELMRDMLRSGYRQPDFRALVLGWADRMSRAADTLDPPEWPRPLVVEPPGIESTSRTMGDAPR